MINLARICLNVILHHPLESYSCHVYYYCRTLHVGFFWKSGYVPVWLSPRYITTLKNGDFNKKKMNYLESDSRISVQKYFEKLNAKIKNFGEISKKDLEKVLSAVEKEGCNQKQSALLLQCCAQYLPDLSPAEKTELTLSTWKIIKNKGSVSLDCYDMLLSSLSNLENENFLSVKDILTEIKERSLIPNEKTYLQLLYYVCSIGDADQVIYIISCMKSACIPLNQTVLNYIILCHGRSGNLAEAENVLKLMDDSLIQPSSITYTMLLKVVAESGNRAKFETLYNKFNEEISDIQRLEVVKSLAVGKLNELIPMVLRNGVWKVTVEKSNSVIGTCENLIYSGQIDSAVLVFDHLASHIKSISNQEDESVFGLFFIQKIVKSNVPVQKIIEVCDKLNRYNSYALFRATETALIYGMQNVAVQLLQKLFEHGHQLRPHYFWPLLVAAGKNSGESGVLGVLDEMIKLGVKPDCETLTEWVCNHCNLSCSVELVRKFQDKGLPLNIVLTSVVNALLFNDRLKEAAALCKKFKSPLLWDKEKFLNVLCVKLFESEDTNSVLTILNSVKDKNAGSDVVNFILTKQRMQLNNDILLRLVKNLEKSGFTLTQQLYDAVDSLCKGRRINVMNNLVGQPYITHPKTMKVNELEDHLLELKSKKMNTRGVLRRLLQEHSRLGNIERVLQIKKELKDSGLKFSPGMLASLLETFTLAGIVEEAEKCLAEIKKCYPVFKLDSYKVIDLATILVKSGYFQRAVDLLKSEKGAVAHESFLRNCWELLNAVADKEGPDKTKEMLDLLVDKNYCAVCNKLLGPLIRSYLFRNDLAGAVDVFVNYSCEYNCTPLMHELLCALFTKESQDSSLKDIEVDDQKFENSCTYSDLLERVITAGIKVHGKNSINVSVIVALAECDLSTRLKKFILALNNNVSITLLIDRCNRLADENKPQVILRIVSAMKKSPNIKCESLYNILLKVYVRRNDCDAALSLWTTLQEDNIFISEVFLKDLALLLKSNKRNVPFSVSQSESEKNI